MKCEMAIMNGSGDTKLIWDSENDDEVKNARRTFNDFKTYKKPPQGKARQACTKCNQKFSVCEGVCAGCYSLIHKTY
tara:strand:- start:27114 stop:27344 length:231 start_codon:yes stop_codon:yes gene_type:complete